MYLCAAALRSHHIVYLKQESFANLVGLIVDLEMLSLGSLMQHVNLEKTEQC